ncbi:TIGR03016 family PEP-CTERM system-associated outer membrane protein [Thauera sp. CAU 1555]|uniref:TIGR03016 family PEP-CTERM system-associated outer membrane protein n=1 Tax=Thauera sedimentorum TaxID=2767595 RepID=A0ABR9BEF3_9RHOO|nr:TIGR03016 family PEP-CTERM system-associated outer membrane protein [Thauera sedimentorum]MBC9073632.1 TIGR03016 family PEP-CTERM system-associated outer membrane protein [Thauera sedimentorum]MBD8504551.1 TIGR03016 family PEP-CTERM system-associated outer membrane protein [Thauera sedimentorum]
MLQCLALALASCAALPVSAQQVRIEPYVSGSLTWTDNLDAASSGGGSGLVADIAPGVSIARDGGRIQGRLDASLRNQVTLSGDKGDSTFLSLLGRGGVEAVDDLFFIDVDASISRDNTSLFGGRIRGDTLNTDSDDEIRTFGIAPRLELRFGDTAATLAYRARWLDSGGELGSQRVGRWLANADNATGFGFFGWGANYGRTDTDYGSSGTTDVSQEEARGILYINVSTQLRLALVGGYESNDYAVRKGESGSITGAGFDWRPNERTIISGVSEKRIFGRGYEFQFKHRRARSSWELGWSRDISSSLQTFDSLLDLPGLRSRYEGLLSGELDPVIREQLERELRALGVTSADLNETVVSNSYFVDRRFRAGFSLIGVRNVLSVSLYRSDRERLGETGFVTLQDDFSIYERIREKSALMSLSHRLSGASAVTATLIRSDARGEGSSAAEIRRTLLSLGLTTRLGPRTTAGLSYRYQKSSGSDDFTENAIIANVAMRF